MKLAQDAHTRAEQQVYECLWANARPMDEISRTITIGFGAMARMVRLSESNARINLRGLIAKLAIEEIGQYDCERSTGRTYRIFNYSEMLRRRKAAGLVWYMRRTLAVVFVDPMTGEPLELYLGRSRRPKNTGPGPKLIPPPDLNLIPDPGPNLGGNPGLNLIPPYREEEREEVFRETSSSGDRLVRKALTDYGTVDDDAVARLKTATAQACPDYTTDELIHFIHIKGALIRGQPRSISNPIGFLLSAVPKCFAGESLQLYRRTEQETRQREAAERARQEIDFQAWRQGQEAILDDPNASEEDKRWARKLLDLPESREGE